MTASGSAWTRYFSHRAVAAGVALSLVGGVVAATSVSGAEPVVINGMIPDRYFSPDGDGFEDTFTASLNFSALSTVTVTVTPVAGGAPVSTETGTTHPQTLGYTVSWDGLTDAGTPAPEGEYDVVVSATTEDGGTGTAAGTAGVDRGGFSATWTSPAAGSELRRDDEVSIGTTDDRAAFGFLQAAGTSEQLSSSSRKTPGGMTFTVLPGGVPDGPTDVEAVLIWWDDLEAWHEQTIAPRSFTLVSQESVALVGSSSWVFPEMRDRWGSPDAEYVQIELGRQATVDVVLRNAAEQVVRTYHDGATCSSNDCIAWVNGRSGPTATDPLLPEGDYSLDVRAEFAGGNVLNDSLAFHVSHAVPAATLTAPTAGSVLNGPAQLSVNVTGGIAAHSGTAYVKNGSFGGIGWLYSDATREPGPVTLDVDLSSTPDGPVEVYVDLSLQDPLGGWHDVRSPAVGYTVSNAVVVTADSELATLSPEATPPVTSVSTSYSVSRDATVTTVVEDADGGVVSTLEDGAWRVSGAHSVSWDGTDESGDPVANGDYTLRISASISSGASGEATRSISVARSDVGTITVSPAGPTVSGELTVTFVPKDGVTPTAVQLYDADYVTGYPVGYLYQSEYDPETLEPTGPWTGSVSTTSYPNGPHRLFARVTTASGTAATPRVALTYANPVQLSVYGDADLYPDDASRDRWDPSVTTTQLADVSTVITDVDGAVVRTLTATNDTSYHDVWWDGRDSSGARVPDGSYTATFTATEPVVPSEDEATATITVRTQDAGAVTEPTAGSTVADRVSLTYTPPAAIADAIYSVELRARSLPAGSYPSSWTLGTLYEATDGVWRIADADTSFLNDGAYEIYAVVVWQSGGLYPQAGTTGMPVTVEQPGALASVSGGRAFTPDGDGYEDTVGISYRVARAAEITRTVVREDGTPIGVTSVDE
ncbi:MAG: hypothetical protein EPN99_07055, partial [Frankiales bacterium]